MISTHLVALVTILVGLTEDVRGCSFTPPTSAPQEASPEINPSWIGYHYEIASWQRWAEDNDSQPNQFSANMYKVVMDRTGGPPFIRLGGTTGEYALYEPNQVEPVAKPITRIKTGKTLNKTMIGPAYWELCKNFDDLGALYVIEVPVGWKNISETVLWATSAWSILNGTQRIRAIEIGNEPNDWPVGGFRPPEYVGAVNDTSYSQIFLNHSEPINQALGFKDGYRIYEAFDTAYSLNKNISIGSPLPIPEAFTQDHIDERNQILQVAHHYYGLTASPEMVGTQLFNHSIIVESMAPIIPWIQFLNTAANGSKIPFLWTELACSLGNTPGYENVLATALWNVDVFLYSMSIGVWGITYSENFDAWFLFWLPVETDGVPAQTFAGFYAVPFVADFIGNTSQSRATVLDYDPGTANENIIAYAAYEDDQPKRIALINFDLWGNFSYNGTQAIPGGGLVNLTEALPGTQNRSITPVEINVPTWCTQVKLKWLQSDLGAYALAPNISYGGSQWTAESMGVEVQDVVPNGSQMLKVTDGKVVVDMPATSAALLWLS